MTSALFKFLSPILFNKNTLIVGLLLALFLLGKAQINSRNEISRVTSNQEILLADNSRSKEQLQLTRSEFKEYVESNDSLARLLRDSLGVSLKKIESLQILSQQSKIVASSILKDTVINMRSDSGTMEPVAIKQSDWSDKWTTVSSRVFPDFRIITTVETVDTIYLTLYWERVGKFLPSIFGKKKYQAEVLNQNPNNTIVVGKNIKVVKR